MFLPSLLAIADEVIEQSFRNASIDVGDDLMGHFRLTRPIPFAASCRLRPKSDRVVALDGNDAECQLRRRETYSITSSASS